MKHILLLQVLLILNVSLFLTLNCTSVLAECNDNIYSSCSDSGCMDCCNCFGLNSTSDHCTECNERCDGLSDKCLSQCLYFPEGCADLNACHCINGMLCPDRVSDDSCCTCSSGLPCPNKWTVDSCPPCLCTYDTLCPDDDINNCPKPNLNISTTSIDVILLDNNTNSNLNICVCSDGSKCPNNNSVQSCNPVNYYSNDSSKKYQYNVLIASVTVICIVLLL